MNVKSCALLVSCFLWFAGPLAAAEIPSAKPDEVGLSVAELEKARAAVSQFIKEGKIPGAVVLVARHGKIVLFDAQSARDVSSGKPMEKDTIFRLYSMTKPITTVAAMILFDRGLLHLDDPVSKYLPELKGVKVHAGGMGSELKLVAASREMTIRDLMRHTSGLTYAGISKTPVLLGANAHSSRQAWEGVPTWRSRILGALILRPRYGQLSSRMPTVLACLGLLEWIEAGEVPGR